jgi:hypothetical protein
MASNAGKTVEKILTGKKASVKQVALPKGSPSWDDILGELWEGITRGAKRRHPGYKTIRKLLSDPEYDK